MTFETRPMTAADIPACVEIINPIIAQGGTTAYETPYTVDGLTAKYLEEPPVTNVVLHNGTIIGFQAAFEIETGTYSIGTFTDRNNPVRGAGAAIMTKTKQDCRIHGGTVILAKITSDNTGGLSFYSKMGFADYAVEENAFTRKDGTTVDRVIKRFVL